MLEHCAMTTAQAAEERIVTPENIAHFKEMYPDKELQLWQWIPFDTSNTDIEMYMKRGGYQALEKALTKKPEAVIHYIGKAYFLHFQLWGPRKFKKILNNIIDITYFFGNHLKILHLTFREI